MPGRSSGWIGVDFDGTLANFDPSTGEDVPLAASVRRVRRYLSEGREVRILTARASRVYKPEAERRRLLVIQEVEDWCERHLGQRLAVTSEKDYGMRWLEDDRALTVDPETGLLLVTTQFAHDNG